MHNDSFSNNIVYNESVSQEDTECVSLVPKERGHISGMVRVVTSSGIIMHSHICKRILGVSGAVSALMNMKTKNRAFAGSLEGWQTEYFSCNENSILCVIKADMTIDFGILPASSYNCYGMGILLQV